jgi:hypothetical protein
MKLSETRGMDACAYEQHIVQAYLYDASDRIHKFAKDAINAFAEGDEQRMMLLGIKRFTKSQPFNVKASRRAIADHLIRMNTFPL